ncbi:barstar family protein [Fusibacter tunisiensis]|uniref:Ribonuclease inhibitor n=1 Tax=Fusibacter tunisiensis TaxID=1008308 RepID=A0ABS2MU97_9FIRM|nr:barstar family protein [Fusibacter tunisiensis]MBM7562925.1 ribonuclease inhibitor [Fusibacter tunisiensis]
MKKVYIEGGQSVTKADLHLQIKNKMGFPDHYGQNLDALYDVLSTWDIPVEICVLNPSKLIHNLGKYAEDFLKTIEEAGEVNWKVKLSTEEAAYEIC